MTLVLPLFQLTLTRHTTHLTDTYSSCHFFDGHLLVLPLLRQSFLDEVHVCVEPLPELEVFLQLVLDELRLGNQTIVERRAVQLTLPVAWKHNIKAIVERRAVQLTLPIA